MFKGGVARGHLAMFISVAFVGLNIPVLKEFMPKWIDGYDATFFRIVGATALFWLSSFFVSSKELEKSYRLNVLCCGMTC